MSCFLVPMVQAVATTVYRKRNSQAIASGDCSILKRNLPSLEKMLWGGTLMLVIDHILSGELVFGFPFFSALASEGGALVMLREMLTVGVPVSLAVSLAWLCMVLVARRREKLA
ncbi:MAG: hypothetical protein MJY61_01820 [Bacteroidales bacterium]|nr:hypothetical protein [Bacteroidales bacterium]